ncbi:glycosyltransferase [Flavobacterium sp.]|uniref:glycosyltransferase family 2 protein n=1 Tax=Flavobacterium sp. TaxID=239 RepID=UPI002625C764|nr:glycosyltransferase [Flavobacterium sp.]MDD3004238.1 glycosyltransferase [Flavobacterium sp.]
MITSLLLFFFIFVYGFFILRLAFGISKIPYFSTQYKTPETTFSIVVPFRNEAKVLPELLESLSALNYPPDLFEIILVDDESEDGFEIKNQEQNIHVLKNNRKSNSPKKDAIETAIQHSKFSWIVTTDADCIVPANWLNTLDAFIRENNVEMVVGAVIYRTENDFLQHFQLLEMMSLQGATIGSFGINQPFLCNGANFAYSKSLFKSLHGFEDSNQIASGDDVFLLQKTLNAKAYGLSKIGYLKNHDFLVFTQPCFSLQALIQQRIRWASKATAYKTFFSKSIALAVLLGNLAVVLGFTLSLFAWMPFWDFYILFALKIVFDFVLLYQTGKFIQPQQIRYYLLSTLFYPFFSVGIALRSFGGTYQWKNRKLA